MASVSAAAIPEKYLYDQDTTVVGTVRTHIIKNRNKSLIELARKFDLGYNEIVEANPGLDPFVPGAGKTVILPLSWIMPDVQVYDGIVINISELRLYYFFTQGGKRQVITFPIGIGDEGTDTPLGSFRIIEKIVGPAWHVPASIRKEKPELPPVVPPGPDNPMGSHAMRLSLPSILIHGTNKPWCVGRKASHGCIRLYPEDIPRLFRMVPTDTPVRIVSQPVKIGVKEGKIYIELHKDKSMNSAACFKMAIALLVKKHLLGQVSSVKLLDALDHIRGFPVEISQDAGEGVTLM
ncbi:MAG TPA: L,D-transpeptidase family protein [Dissulfurispiraceae bacterium]|nr:L,D-transpeptidase family protein [Dissulfurispiraceae bacterium]